MFRPVREAGARSDSTVRGQCSSRQTRRPGQVYIFAMEARPAPRLVSADRFNNGLLITFDDGKCAFYSSDLLRAVFSQARELKETDRSE